MVKDHLARKETRCCHIGFFYMHYPKDRITDTMACYTSDGALAGTNMLNNLIKILDTIIVFKKLLFKMININNIISKC